MYNTAILQQNFNTEQVLVVLLCRLYMGTATKAEAEAFINSNAIDYHYLHRVVTAHNIRPFIHHIITRHQLEVDTDFREKLTRYFEQHRLRTLEQTFICHTVQQMFAASGVQAIAFKGTCFGARYYDDVSLRESTDIDVLIPPAAVPVAKQMFEKAGYTAKVSVPDAYLGYFTRQFKELVYVAPARTHNGYSVEAHWKLLNYYFGDYPDYDFFAAGTTHVNIGETRLISLLPAYDFLAVASNHFIKDMGTKFKYLVDMAVLLQKHPDLDARWLAAVADEYHCRKKTELGLYAVEMFLGCRINGWQYAHRFNPNDIRYMLSVPLSIADFNVTNIRFLRKALVIQDNLKMKRQFLFRSFCYFWLPTDNDIHAAGNYKLPVWLLGILRPFRLMSKAFGQILRSGSTNSTP